MISLPMERKERARELANAKARDFYNSTSANPQHIANLKKRLKELSIDPCSKISDIKLAQETLRKSANRAGDESVDEIEAFIKQVGAPPSRDISSKTDAEKAEGAESDRRYGTGRSL